MAIRARPRSAAELGVFEGVTLAMESVNSVVRTCWETWELIMIYGEELTYDKMGR